MTTKKTDFPDLNSLAIEACDMWQEHLSTLASDPAARAELTRFLEPQRRLFADWAAMMQQGGNHEKPSPRSAPQSPDSSPGPSFSSPPSSAPNGDDALRVAQLALRVAELEKRVSQLEERASPSARRTQRATS